MRRARTAAWVKQLVLVAADAGSGAARELHRLGAAIGFPADLDVAPGASSSTSCWTGGGAGAR